MAIRHTGVLRFCTGSYAPARLPAGAARSIRRTLVSQAFIRGPSEPPLLEQTIGQHFASIVREHGDCTAVISRHQNKHLSYDKLDQQSNSLARGLEKIGVRKGDRVAVSLGNNIEYATATYACFKLGAILVPLNPTFNAQQVVSALNHLSTAHLIIGAETSLARKDPRSNDPLLRHIVPNIQARKLESALVPSLKHVIIVDNSSGRVNVSDFGCINPYEEVLDDGGLGKALSERDLDPDDVVNIQFTSGTTSAPKAACLSHRSILNNGKQIGDRMLLTHKDVFVTSATKYALASGIDLQEGYMATATHGATIVFPTEAFDPQATLESVRDYRCTALYGVPTMFVAELELMSTGNAPKSGYSSLRTGIAAGSVVPAELMRKLHKTLNLTQLTNCYGMTETSPVSFMTTTDDPIEKRINTVGRLLPHVTAKVVDPGDHSKILGIGERGELAVSGYLVMKGYWEDPIRTKEAMITDENNVTWMHTGDEARMDAEGYVQITGRIKDTIIRGGENIHPLEVENCLFAHPAVSEVSVVGVPDERYGEQVGAFVILHHDAKVTAEELRAWVREKLSGHLVPKFIFWVNAYPKTASGKIQKFILREQAVQLIGQGQGLQ